MIRLIYSSLLLLFCLNMTLGAQEPPFSVSGNGEWLMRYSKPNNSGIGASLVKKLYAAAVLNMRGGFSSELGFLSTDIRVEKQALGSNEPEKISFNEAYVGCDLLNTFGLYGGIRRYPYQYSYYFNPTFVANAPRDLFEPDRNAIGIPMALIWGTFGPVSPKVFFSPGDTRYKPDLNPSEMFLGAQVDAYITGTEVYLNGIWSEKRERSIGAAARATFSGFTTHAEGAVLWNNKRQYPIAIEQALMTGTLFKLRDDETFWKLSLGVNRTIGSRALVTLEYFHDHSGFTEKEFSNFSKDIDFIRNSPPAASVADSPPFDASAIATLSSMYNPGFMRRNYLFLSYTHTIKSTWKLGLRTVGCVDDTSGYVLPSIYWLPTERFEFGGELFVKAGAD